MKRWKITAKKPTPVTCENCEEGRLIVCRSNTTRTLLIRKRLGIHLYNSSGECPGFPQSCTFIRYLDPDPEPQPKQVRYEDVGDGVVFSVLAYKNLLFWKTDDKPWSYDTETGAVSVESATVSQRLLVTLTGQVAELVEDE